MLRPILLGCFEPPSYGGAATSAYQLYRTLRPKTEVAYLNLIEHGNAGMLEQHLGANYVNPEGLPGVFQHVLERPTYQHQPGLEQCMAGRAPSLLVGIGYIAAYVMKQAWPDLPLVMLTTGCQQVKDALFAGDFGTVQELLSGKGGIRMGNDIEQKAFEMADLVLAHSSLTHKLCRLYFPEYASKLDDRIVWFYDWIHSSARRQRHRARPFRDRDIDLLFVASDWDRIEKGYSMVQALSRRFSDRAVHLVGHARGVPVGVTHHGLLPNERVLNLIGRARVLVCTSSFDAAPGILFEGAALGCNLVASANCGNHRICNPSLLADELTEDGFAECIRTALQGPVPANTGYFERQRCLDHLLGVLDAYRYDSGRAAQLGAH